MNKTIIDRINQKPETDTSKLLAQTEAVRQLLEYCMVRPAADIKIVINHDDGHTATLDAFDHAALVQGLHQLMEDFQDEL